MTRQAVVALNRGDIDAAKLGPRTLVVMDNAKFEAWEPNRVRQAVWKTRGWIASGTDRSADADGGVISATCR